MVRGSENTMVNIKGYRMKTLVILCGVTLSLAWFGCSEQSSTEAVTVVTGKLVSVSNLYANDSTAKKTFFRLSDSTVVTGSDTATNAWDIAFYKTTIYTNSGTSGSGNGGALVLTGTDFHALKTVPDGTFRTDSAGTPAVPTGSGSGWYVYDATRHTINPAAGVVLIIKTGTGKYAKLQIQSYYKNAPAMPSMTDASGYYSFRYFYQPDGSKNLE